MYICVCVCVCVCVCMYLYMCISYRKLEHLCIPIDIFQLIN